MKQVFVVISEVSKWDIELLEDNVSVGDVLHYKPFEDEEPQHITDGEYLWDGNKIQVDSDGKVVMINGETAEVELKKDKMANPKDDKETKAGMFAKVTEWFEKHGIKAKVTEDKPEEEGRAEIVVKLKAFAKEKFGEARAEKFVDVTLADGSVAVIEPDVEVGAAMVLMDEEGNPVAAPVGEYELEDGRVIVVEEEGVIAAVNEAPAEEEDDEEEMSTDEKEQQRVKKVIESIIVEKEFIKAFSKELGIDKIAAELETEKETNTFLKEENEALVAHIAELEGFVKEVFTVLLDEPAKKPAVKNNNPLAKEAKENIFTKPFKRN
jgi:hypothetical protein